MNPAQAMLSAFFRRTLVRLDWGLGSAKITEPVRRIRGVRVIKDNLPNTYNAINQHVYTLYGLTADEIKIVEGV